MILPTIPIVPYWNVNSSCVSTPDGGLLYLNLKSISYIGGISSNQQAKLLIKTFSSRQSIVCLDVDPCWDNEKLFAAVAEDNTVQIWDFDKNSVVSGHKAHTKTLFNNYDDNAGSLPAYLNNKVLLSYMQNRNILSIDFKDIIIYCVASNTYYRRHNFVASRNNKISTLRCSPFNEHIFAVGTVRGLVLICDLQKMITIYTLSGHSTSITSISWTVVDDRRSQPSIIEPKHKKSSVTHNIDDLNNDEELFDIYDYDYLENEFGVLSNVQDKKNDVAIDEIIGVEKIGGNKMAIDYVEACKTLKEDIDALKSDQTDIDGDDVAHRVVTLADCQKVANTFPFGDDNSVCSLEFIEQNSSDDDEVVKNLSGNGFKQEILHQVEVHEEPVLSKEITDKHTENVEVQEEHRDFTTAHSNILLATSSLDGNIRIWNTETGAACDNLKKNLGQSGYGKNSSIVVCWINGTQFLTNNKKGDLHLWTWQSGKNVKGNSTSYKYKQDKCYLDCQGVVSFTISEKHKLLWAISHHRDIYCLDMCTGDLIAKYGTVSTNIGVMRECPDDNNKIALGFSDNRVGIIDISNISQKKISIENYPLRNESPVLAVAWSPDEERLAYGTLEGRVGVILIGSHKNQIISLNSMFGKPVYSMDWCNNHIFVVCNHKLGVYRDNLTKKDAYIIPNIIYTTAVAVRPDNYLIIGTQQGHLQIYRYTNVQNSISCEQLQDLSIATRYITDIAINPIDKDFVVVGANINVINILKFDPDSCNVSLLRKYDINVPKVANLCVRWSHRNTDEFLTCGTDGALRVWNLLSDSNEEKCIKQFNCPLKSGLFLPSDGNIVMCSGKTTSLEFFNILSAAADNSQLSNVQNTTSDNVHWAMEIFNKTAEKRSKQRDKNIFGEKKAINTAEIDDEDSTANRALATMLDDLKIVDSPHQVQSQQKDPNTILYLMTKELNRESIEKLNLILNVEDWKSAVLSAKLFGTKLEAKEILKTEIKNCRGSSINDITTMFMSQIDFNIKDDILKCIQNKQLKDWHVAIAPGISYSFWQNCCEAYAEQLIEQGCILHAASYFMALHNHYKTVEFLLEKQFFKEALLVARVYLQPDDPLLEEIIDKWIKYIVFTGNFSTAAFLCVLSGQKERAHEVLSKTRNVTPEIENLLKLLKPNI